MSDCCPYIRIATDGLADDRTHDASSPHHPPWHYSSSLRLPLQCPYIHIAADGLANDCTHSDDSCPHITDEQSNKKSNTEAYTEGYTLSVTLPHDKLAFSFADTPAFTFADFESFRPTNNIIWFVVSNSFSANDATDSDCRDFFTDTYLDSKSCGIAPTFHTSYSCYDHSTINRSTNRAGCGLHSFS